MPDADVVRDEQGTHLQEALSARAFTLLLCGRLENWDGAVLKDLADGHAGLLEIRHLTREPGPGVLRAGNGDVLVRLGLRAADDAAQYLVRPDGYIAFRCAGRNLGAVDRFITAWQADQCPPGHLPAATDR